MVLFRFNYIKSELYLFLKIKIFFDQWLGDDRLDFGFFPCNCKAGNEWPGIEQTSLPRLIIGIHSGNFNDQFLGSVEELCEIHQLFLVAHINDGNYRLKIGVGPAIKTF